mgnify:FL=1
MKYILSFVGIVTIACAICFCGNGNKSSNDDYMRIHVVANSNSDFDQNLKYKVKDVVVDFLIPLLSEAENKEEAAEIISTNLNKIQEIANATLKFEGASYSANVAVKQENLPDRAYDDLVLEAGVYDCLNIELGNANGDNWWCVVFPAVCFLSSKNPENVVYISKIWEIINRVTQ